MTRNEEYLKTIMDALGGDSTKIPPYTINSEDDLKYIAAAFAERAVNKGKFIVTLTPTSEDFSGVMDKTLAEISAAYEAGQEIWLKLEAEGRGSLMERAFLGNGSPAATYPSFNARFLDASTDMMLYAFTGYTDDGTTQTYATYIYSLTPANA